MGNTQSDKTSSTFLGAEKGHSEDHLFLIIIAVIFVLWAFYLLRKCFRKMAGSKSITFTFHHQVKKGEEVRVLGNVPELGKWDTNRAPPMRLIDGHTNDPVWVSTVDVTFPTNGLEYKYVLVTRQGGRQIHVEWEPCANRVLRAPNEDALTLHQAWGGRDFADKAPSFVAGKTPDCTVLTQPLIGG